MRGYRKVFWAGVLAALLLVGAVANAQNPKVVQKQAGAVALRGMFMAGLDLTDQQKEQIRTILANHKVDIRSAAVENMKARKDLRQAMAAGADQAALKS